MSKNVCVCVCNEPKQIPVKDFYVDNFNHLQTDEDYT